MSSEPVTNIITRTDLQQQLLTCGFKKGDILEIHASIKAIGYILGGAQTLLDAIIDVIGIEGTLIMAAQVYDNSEPAFFEHPPIPVESYASFRKHHPAFRNKLDNIRHMGDLARAMMIRPNSYMSDHPQDAFIAMGKYAKWITQNHSLNAQLGPDSPLGKMLELKSKLVLIGVNYDNATGMHLGEHLSGVRPNILQGARVLVHGESQWVQFNGLDYDSDDFIKPGELLEKRGLVKFSSLGKAEVKIFNLSDATDVVIEYFRGAY